MFSIDQEISALTVYDYKTGKVVETFALPVDQEIMISTIDITGNLTFLNQEWIHRIRPNGSMVETVIDDRGFAYACFGSRNGFLLAMIRIAIFCTLVAMGMTLRYMNIA